jgi:uncharacterized SAM-binding protein YcdF (DUF218 family)
MSFFEFSKIFGFLIDPLNVVFLLIFIATLLLWGGRHLAARRVLTFVLAIFAIVIVFPIGDLLLSPLEQRFPPLDPWPPKVDGIIMLGGAQRSLLTKEYGQPALNRHAERMTTFLALARHYPDAKLLFSGGSGEIRHQDVSEVDTVRLFLKQQGFNPDRVRYESKSRNTYENAVLSKNLAKPKPNEIWLLVTSAAHLPRAVGVFQNIGWSVVPVPCDYEAMKPTWLPSLDLLDAMQNIHYALHEWSGLAVYYFTGKTGRFFPGSDS